MGGAGCRAWLGSRGPPLAKTRGGRQLEADRLAEAGREHNQAVTAVKRGLHGGDLLRPEAIEPPVLLERGKQVCTGVAVGQSNAAQAFGVTHVERGRQVERQCSARKKKTCGRVVRPRSGDGAGSNCQEILGVRICTRRGRRRTRTLRRTDAGLHNGRQARQEEQEAAHLRRVVVLVARRVGRHTCCSGHDAGGHACSFCSAAGGRPASRGRPTTHTYGGFAAAPRVHGVP